MSATIDSINDNSTNSVRSNSVTSLFAEYTNLLQLVTAQGSDDLTYLPGLERLSKYGNDFIGFLCFSIDSGCRCNEALRLDLSDIMFNGNVILKASKGSANRIVNTKLSSNYLIMCKKRNYKPFYGLNYMRCYRAMDELGLSAYFGNNSVRSVTHWSRHINALLSHSVTEEMDVIKVSLGHKSVKSTSSYVKKGRKSIKKNIN
jgi:integrase